VLGDLDANYYSRENDIMLVWTKSYNCLPGYGDDITWGCDPAQDHPEDWEEKKINVMCFVCGETYVIEERNLDETRCTECGSNEFKEY
jgi:DNA-directed RNA polymerase subunit RPC12/RpoP